VQLCINKKLRERERERDRSDQENTVDLDYFYSMRFLKILLNLAINLARL
jgi:hypothetical protein